jgi:predicted ATPase with chaperone activity
MVSTVYTAGLEGVNGFAVTVECSLAPMFKENPTLDVVGLPDNAVKEARRESRALSRIAVLVFPMPAWWLT